MSYKAYRIFIQAPQPILFSWGVWISVCSFQNQTFMPLWPCGLTMYSMVLFSIIGKKIETSSIFLVMGQKSGFPQFSRRMGPRMKLIGYVLQIILHLLVQTRARSGQRFPSYEFFKVFYFKKKRVSRRSEIELLQKACIGLGD